MHKLKLLCLLAALLCLASLVAAQTPQLVVFNGYVAPAGYPFGPATIAVCTVGGSGGPPCSPLTIIYTDASGTKQKPNPFTIDPQGNGNFNFFANCGTQYALQSYGNGYTTTLTTITTSVCTGGGGGNPVGPASGDLNGSYPGPGVVRINGGSLPASKPYVGTNASGQLIDATPPLSKPLIGTNASGQIVDATPPLSKNIIGTNGTGNIIDATALTLSNPLSVIHNPASVTITGATPSVTGGNIFATNNGSATTITNFTGGVDSQTITVNCGDANTTIANGTNIATFAGGNLVCIANQAYSFTFYASLSKWVQVGGGGNPGGIPVQSQFNSNNTFAGSSCVNLPTISSTSVNFDCDTHPKGLNPYLDVTRYGVRACNPGATPCIPGTGASIVSGNTAITVTAAQFLNGDGVSLYGAGVVNTMTTPTAPTVTPSIAETLLGTRIVQPGPAGSTTYTYEIFAEDQNGGFTVASPAGTTTTGQASLGLNVVALTSCTRANNIVTCTTSSAHGLSIGTTPQMVYMVNMPDTTFQGWFYTSNVADSTHFSVTTGRDTRNGETLSTTGGVVYWWNCNHITWARVTGAYRYWILGRVGGSLATIGYSWPENKFAQSVAGQPINEGVLSWDDFGATLMGGLTIPNWIPSVPPTVAGRDTLTTTVVSGGGTTSLVLANAPGLTSANTGIVLDATPGILAAANAAFGPGGTGLPIYFPATSNATSSTYVVNSFLDLTGLFNTSLVINGTLTLNDTLAMQRYSKIRGNPTTQNTETSFPFDSLPVIQVNYAYPGIHIMEGDPFRIEGVSIQGNVNYNDALLVVQDFGGANPGSFYTRTEFNSGTVNDSFGQALVVRGVNGGLSAQVNLEQVLVIPGGPGSLPLPAPSVICADCALLNLNFIQAAHRGFFMGIDATGGGMQSRGTYFQASFMPAFTLGGADGLNQPIGQSIFYGQSTMDTSGSPLIWIAKGAESEQLYLEGIGVTGVGTNTITGAQISVVWGRSPISSNFNIGTSSNTGGPGIACPVEGVFATNPVGACNFEMNFYSDAPVMVGNSYPIFIDQNPIAAVTATLAAGGSLSIGTHTWQVAPIWLNGSVGRFSYISAPLTTTTGNQTANLSWTAVPGGCLGYVFMRDGSVGSVGGPGYIQGCNTHTFTDTGIAVGATPANIAGGSSTQIMQGTQGIESGGPVYAPSLQLYSGLTNFFGIFSNPGLSTNRTYNAPDVSGTLCILDANCFSTAPKTLFDNFNRSALNTSGPCPTGSCYQTGNISGGTPTIVGNQISWSTSTASADANLNYPAGGFSTYEFAQFTVTGDVGASSAYAAVLNRAAGTYYECFANNNGTNLTRILKGLTIEAQGTFALAVGDVLRCESTPATGGTLVNLKRCPAGAMSSCTTEINWLDTSPLPPGLTGFLLSNFGAVVTESLDDFNTGTLSPSLAALDSEQVWTQPQHIPSLVLGEITPSGGDVIPSGAIFSSLWSPSLSLCTDAAGKAVTTGCSGNISGMTSGQVPIAGSASTITSSKPLQGTDANVLSSGTVTGTAATLCTDANGGATTTGCTGGSISGLSTGQVPIAGSASSLTSSKALQGTDANILTSSTIAAGAGNLLCTDTGSGATTSGCAVFNTQSAATNTNIAATNMVASTSALHSYLFQWTISLTAVGVGCTSSTTINMNAIFTDPNVSTTTTELLGQITIAAGGNGTVGFVAQGTDNILAKTTTAVQYSTTGYTAGTGCTTNPTYQVSPTLVQLW